MASRMVVACEMSRASAKDVSISSYSVFERLLGTFTPVGFHCGLLMYDGSPRSARAMMFRLFSVLLDLLVTHISTLFTLMPLAMVGRVFMFLSYCSRKKCERKKCRFSS